MGITAPELQQPPTFTENPDETYAAKLRDFIDRKAPYDHVHHIRKFRRLRKADMFYQSMQWLQASFNDGAIDPTRTPHLSQRTRDPNNPDSIPMPVYNEVAPHVQNEQARLGRPEYEPYVRPTGHAPDAKIKEACRTGKDILDAEKDRMGWDEKAETLYHHMVIYGGGWMKGWWDVSMDSTVRVGVEGALMCPEPGCDFRLASGDLTGEQAGQADVLKPDQPSRILAQDSIGENGRDVSYSVDTCLQCDDHTIKAPQVDEMGSPVYDDAGAMVMGEQKQPGPPKLKPFTPVDAELMQVDMFERSLGKDVPLGQWAVSNPSGYDTFAENLGHDVTMSTMGEITEVHIESLDWIRARYSSKADQVKAEAPTALLKWHPVLGERALFSNTATGPNLFRNHCRVKEYHKKPYMEQDPKTGKWAMNKGRSIIMAGNVVLLDGPFMIESENEPGTYIERVHYDYVPWEFRSGGREMDGVSLMEMMFDAQENINEAKSQTQDTRKRMASPKWLSARMMNLDYQESGEAGSHWLYDPIPIQGLEGIMPKEVGSTTISPGVADEIERDMEYLERVSGKSSIEDGSVPPGVSAAAAIQMLAEHTAERRRPRIKRIRKMFERVWRHGLELNHEFVREERTYRTKNESDEWCDRAWKGADIAGQFDVRIDAEPEHDTEVQKQERTRDAIINLKILNPQDPSIAMTVAHELDLAPELFENQNLQDESAEREFIDYFDTGIPPVIDSDLDSDAIHYDRHGRDCHSEKWRALEREARWNQALMWLYGWDQLKPVMPPQPAAPPPQIDGAQPDQMALAPQPVMMSAFDMFEQEYGPSLPPLPELHIAAFWGTILEGHPLNEGMPPEQAAKQKEALQKVIRFRAHIAAHKRNEQGQVAAAQGGAAQVAAPESPATSAGTIPTQGQIAA